MCLQLIYIYIYIYIYVCVCVCVCVYKEDFALNNPTKAYYIYLIYMYSDDLALNNLQGLICHKILQNQIIYISYICIKKILH